MKIVPVTVPVPFHLFVALCSGPFPEAEMILLGLAGDRRFLPQALKLNGRAYGFSEWRVAETLLGLTDETFDGSDRLLVVDLCWELICVVREDRGCLGRLARHDSLPPRVRLQILPLLEHDPAGAEHVVRECIASQLAYISILDRRNKRFLNSSLTKVEEALVALGERGPGVLDGAFTKVALSDLQDLANFPDAFQYPRFFAWLRGRLDGVLNV